MAKRSIRKTDPDDTTAPTRRRKSTSDDATAPKARVRRKSDVAPQPDAVTPVTAVVTAEAEVAAPTNGTADYPSAGYPSSTDVPHDLIAERAYQIYLERGATPGDPMLDWLNAEQQLREQLVRSGR